MMSVSRANWRTDLAEKSPLIKRHRDEEHPRNLMGSYPPEPMRMWPISTRVNKPESDDPSILEPVELAATG
jgi:putative SOS response-associated peptidase YedK